MESRRSGGVLRVYAPNAAFASPSGLTRGRDAVLARYRAKYPDAAARGTLSFEIVETELAPGLEVTPFDAACPATSTARRCWPAGR